MLRAAPATLGAWFLLSALLGHLNAAEPSAPGSASAANLPWWHHYPTYIGDINSRAAVSNAAAWHGRMVSGNYAADPAWGAYGQLSSAQQLGEPFNQAKQSNLRWITWVEAFGECMLYAAAFERRPDGSFLQYDGSPGLAQLSRSAWGWESGQSGNALRWVGIHNAINDEDFMLPQLSRTNLAWPTPAYPDGRPAIGWLMAAQYPLSARVYDAAGSKDINGKLAVEFEGLPDKANTTDATGNRLGSTNGLYAIILDKSRIDQHPGRKLGDQLHAGILNVGKDAAAPFWADYIRVSAREIIRRNVDGLWCDNYSPFNNFGIPPLHNAFGDWSEARFRQFLQRRCSGPELRELNIDDPAHCDVRSLLKQQAAAFLARDTSDIHDPAWRDPRWLDVPIWNLYKVFKQQVGQEALRNFYRAVKEEAALAGRPDFLVAGNDLPIFGLGWAHGDWLDMVSTEFSPAWGITTGSRGIMLPPRGKFAVVCRAALAHQNGPYATMWYYLRTPYDKCADKPELAKVLMAEAFANDVFLKYGDLPDYPGTPETAAWWNGFVTRAEPRFGSRVPAGETGVVYSPDNQLFWVVPGSHALDHNHQPHSFEHWGIATLLVDRHIPYRVIPDWKLTPAGLAGFRTIYLPNVECLDDAAAQALLAWVRDGGHLVMTGATAMRQGTAGCFRKRNASALAPLARADMSGSGTKAATRVIAALELAGNDPTKVAVRQFGTNAAIPTAASAASSPSDLLRTSFGRGCALWSPRSWGLDYYLAHDRAEHFDRLATNAIAVAIFDAAVDRSALDARELPVSVGIFCHRSQDSDVLFADLVNYQLDPVRDALAPQTRLRFRLHLPPGATAAIAETITPDATAPAVLKVEAGWANVDLPELLHFASIKITCRK